MHPRAKVELIASAIYMCYCMLPMLPMQKALHHYDVMSVQVTWSWNQNQLEKPNPSIVNLVTPKPHNYLHNDQNK